MKEKVNSGGNRAGKRSTALLIVDMVSDFNFDQGARLHNNALSMAPNLARLKIRVKDAGHPVIYVNDNYQNWREDFDHQVKTIADSAKRGADIIEILRPDRDDYYVLKPQRSGFYETPLHVLLKSMGVSRLIVTGVTTDICVLFTAHDARMRGYELAVPSDCSAAVKDEYHDAALSLLKRVADADTRTGARIGL